MSTDKKPKAKPARSKTAAERKGPAKKRPIRRKTGL